MLIKTFGWERPDFRGLISLHAHQRKVVGDCVAKETRAAARPRVSRAWQPSGCDRRGVLLGLDQAVAVCVAIDICLPAVWVRVCFIGDDPCRCQQALRAISRRLEAIEEEVPLERQVLAAAGMVDDAQPADHAVGAHEGQTADRGGNVGPGCVRYEGTGRVVDLEAVDVLGLIGLLPRAFVEGERPARLFLKRVPLRRALKGIRVGQVVRVLRPLAVDVPAVVALGLGTHPLAHERSG